MSMSQVVVPAIELLRTSRLSSTIHYQTYILFSSVIIICPYSFSFVSFYPSTQDVFYDLTFIKLIHHELSLVLSSIVSLICMDILSV